MVEAAGGWDAFRIERLLMSLDLAIYEHKGAYKEGLGELATEGVARMIPNIDFNPFESHPKICHPSYGEHCKKLLIELITHGWEEKLVECSEDVYEIDSFDKFAPRLEVIDEILARGCTCNDNGGDTCEYCIWFDDVPF
jgi:hypothetical protein